MSKEKKDLVVLTNGMIGAELYMSNRGRRLMQQATIKSRKIDMIARWIESRKCDIDGNHNIGTKLDHPPSMDSWVLATNLQLLLILPNTSLL